MERACGWAAAYSRKFGTRYALIERLGVCFSLSDSRCRLAMLSSPEEPACAHGSQSPALQGAQPADHLCAEVQRCPDHGCGHVHGAGTRVLAGVRVVGCQGRQVLRGVGCGLSVCCTPGAPAAAHACNEHSHTHAHEGPCFPATVSTQVCSASLVPKEGGARRLVSLSGPRRGLRCTSRGFPASQLRCR